MTHARIVNTDGPTIHVSCQCGEWSTTLEARSGVLDEAATAFRLHMADVHCQPTPDWWTPEGSLATRPGMTIPPLHLLVSSVAGLVLWALIGAAVVGVLR